MATHSSHISAKSRGLKRALALLFPAVVAIQFPATAAEPAPPPSPPLLPVVAQGRVQSVIAPATLVLEDGTRLTPALLAPIATADLADWRGHPVEARWTGPELDRHARQPAHLIDPARNRWWQAERVAAGFNRVWSDVPTAPGHATLLLLEEQARASGRGHWQSLWQPRPAATAAALPVGTLQLIDGTVRQARLSGTTLWLDFGADWRQDFSVAIPAAVRRTLPAALRQPDPWPGRAVRVRGWLRGSGRGPLITLGSAADITPLETSGLPAPIPGSSAIDHPDPND